MPGGPWSMIPFGTFAPSFANWLGARRNSTTSCSSAFASSAPATSPQLTPCLDSALISCGFVRGISFIVRQMKKQMSPMKMMGAHVMIVPCSWSQSYQFISAAGCGRGDVACGV